MGEPYETEDWSKDAPALSTATAATGSLARVALFRQNGQPLRQVSYEFSEDRTRGVARFSRDIGLADQQRAAGSMLGAIGDSMQLASAPPSGSIACGSTVAAAFWSASTSPVGGGAQVSDAVGAYGRAYIYASTGLVESVRNLDTARRHTD